MWVHIWLFGDWFGKWHLWAKIGDIVIEIPLTLIIKLIFDKWLDHFDIGMQNRIISPFFSFWDTVLNLEVGICQGGNIRHLTYLRNRIFLTYIKYFVLLFLICFFLDLTDTVLKLHQVKAYWLFVFGPFLLLLLGVKLVFSKRFWLFLSYGQETLIIFLKIFNPTLIFFSWWIKLRTWTFLRIPYTCRTTFVFFFVLFFFLLFLLFFLLKSHYNIIILFFLFGGLGKHEHV